MGGPPLPSCEVLWKSNDARRYEAIKFNAFHFVFRRYRKTVLHKNRYSQNKVFGNEIVTVRIRVRVIAYGCRYMRYVSEYKLV